ncbi:MAG: ABC transporter substrate-binding protein [Sulfurimonas sp.]|uniref:ABC transporter substrate-binding protein n=1 Tax=Sulfurimonas sp. TaxID=2022749 RepID=UPI0025D73A7E|nr:ABC transporter substrate-binding protein [Sulfurimonas sp.]MCK9492177.1 ABC transporter substrate-binding protein [Sulfurimonas sp.]
MQTISKLILLLILTLSSHAKILKDRAGVDVEVPQNIQKAFGSSPPMNYLLYALNPKKMSGLNFKAKNNNNDASEEFLSKEFLSLDVIGSFHGGGQSINLETIIKHRPDLILLWEDDLLVERVKSEIEKTKIATITLPFRKIEDMPYAFSFAGEAIDEKPRGDLLASYASKVIEEVSESLKGAEPIKYYYAEGVDGLSTECHISFHVEALNFAGGDNVHRCQQGAVLGLERISFETLLSYDPEIIIAQNELVYKNIFSNPIWKHLKAVKANRVYLVPNKPFNWIDRPPSFMRIIGIQWLTKIFHPELYKIDLAQRIKEFYSLYLNVELSEEQIKQILGEKN